jgi:hypothetical protein
VTLTTTEDSNGDETEEERPLYWFNENTFHQSFNRNWRSQSMQGRPAQGPLYWYLVLLWMANKGELKSVTISDAILTQNNILDLACAGAREMVVEWKEWCGKERTVKDMKDVYLKARDEKGVEKNFLLQNCVEMRQWVDCCICEFLQSM